MCREEGRIITVHEKYETLHISKRGVFPKESPQKKILRSTEHGNTDDEQLECPCAEIDLETENDDDLKELVALLPGVIKGLKENGKWEDYKAFNKLLSDNAFPLDNIAFLLFLDVVRWYSQETTTSLMRYSEDCKLFWRTGYKLFRGRFLRFMGGPKHKGHNLQSFGSYHLPAQSNINFVVPDKKVLSERNKMIPESPGIISEMIKDIAENDPNKVLTYKMCVDGKKINPSSRGEVNLWGYENPPTFESRKKRVEDEMSYFTKEINRIERNIEMGHVTMTELDATERVEINASFRNSITLLSNRIKDLRMLKVKKGSVLKKLQEQVTGDWRTSRYALIISSLRTNIYDIENCIEDILNTNDKLCKYAAADNSGTNRSNSFTEAKEVKLLNQENYVCLGNACDLNQDTALVKQRSATWLNLRESCLATGSTINKAIGLEGLKQQRTHIEIKLGEKVAEQISDDLQRKFDYGTKNEINAVATFIATFLPAFTQDTQLYEEGCYVFKENYKPYFIVSPDGSVRKSGNESEVLAAVEIKCPIPGKTYTTPIQYALPHYYVPQVLSEMKCLDVTNLNFVSYGQQSTAIHSVDFDEKLWNQICTEVKLLNSAQIPKKLSTTIPELKSNIEKFRKSQVKLIAELKSKKAISCEHSTTLTGRIYHECHENSPESVMLSDVQKTFIRGCDSIKVVDKLCSQKASEVLVFLVADLDRIHKQETPNYSQ